jgi:hypothetical protein
VQQTQQNKNNNNNNNNWQQTTTNNNKQCVAPQIGPQIKTGNPTTQNPDGAKVETLFSAMDQPFCQLSPWPSHVNSPQSEANYGFQKKQKKGFSI